MVRRDGAVVGENHCAIVQQKLPKPRALPLDMCGIPPYAFRISRNVMDQ